MRSFTLLSLSALLLTCFGCGSGIPDELRNLVPVTITVTNGSTPIPGILVRLSAKGGQGAYAVNAVTNESGTAEIQSSRSSFSGKGAPAGTYAVVLVENVSLPAELEPLETDQDLPPAQQAAKERKREIFLRKNQTLPPVLTASGTSPLELVVAQGQDATLAVDVAVHR